MNESVYMLLSNPCDPDPRVQFEAETLASRYKVKIIAWDRNGNSSQYEQRDNYDIERFQKRSQYGSGIKQLFGFIRFYIKAIRILFKDKPKYVHCHDLDTLFAGFIYKIFTKNSRLVYDAHEIYSEMITKNNTLRAIIVWFEKILLKKVSLFITVGEIRKKWYKDNNYKNDVVIVGNWKKRKNETTSSNEKKATYKILYVGSLNEERNIEYILERVSNDNRFELIIGGSGSQVELVKEYSNKYSNISFLGFIKDQDYFDKLNSEADIIYYGLDESNAISITAVPNKMFEAITYNKVFYATFIGEILFFSEKYDVFFPVNTSDATLDSLYEYVSNNEEMKILEEKNNLLYENYNVDRASSILLESYAQI